MEFPIILFVHRNTLLTNALHKLFAVTKQIIHKKRVHHTMPNQPTAIAGCHCLPGWTDDKGFFVTDGDDFVIVQMKRMKVPLWEPLRFQGMWREDEWGIGRFEASQLTSLPHH
jgi:hypothetical protein